MNRDALWVSDRWRPSGETTPGAPHARMSPLPQASQHAYQPGHQQRQPGRPQLSAPQSLHPTSPVSVVPESRNDQPSVPRELPRLTDPFAAYSDRRSEDLTNPRLPREAHAGPWRSLPDESYTSSSHSAEAPHLTLHIPQQTSDLKRVSTTLPSKSKPHGGSHLPSYTPVTSLPSFASFHERATRSDDGVEEPDFAPVSSRSHCTTCPKLKLLVHDIAVAFGEIDEVIQTRCSKTAVKSDDIPGDGPVNVATWVLDRLPYTKASLQDITQRFREGNQLQRNASPPTSLKRVAEPWDQEDLFVTKRPRSGIANELPFQLPPYTSRDGRRESIGFIYGREPQQGYSPPPTESVPGSAYPKQSSPTLNARLNPKALQSPPHFANTPSVAASLPPPTVASIGSPATSYQHATPIHTASTNSATSAHIADLQHQVTLKSLSLETLQREYAALLQKLQRERAKTQTIEKKSCVADQEVNELTGRNEDLTERVKELEAQLEDSEKKREADRVHSTQEKEQWGRMLEMGGRLQFKAEADRKKWSDEKAMLERRIGSLTGDRQVELPRVSHTTTAQGAEQNKCTATGEMSLSKLDHGNDPSLHGRSAALLHASSHGEIASLRGEVTFLNSRVESLRSALQECHTHNQDVDSKTRKFLDDHTQRAAAIARVLKDDASKTDAFAQDKPVSGLDSSRSSPYRQKPARASSGFLKDPSFIQVSPQVSKTPPATFEYYENGKKSTAIIKDVARTVSPRLEELGFHVAPTTSSPEDLIRALGPVPAPLPSLQVFGPQQPWLPPQSEPKRSVGDTVPPVSARPQDKPIASPPLSWHSSPGGSKEGDDSSSSQPGRSPESYTREPESRATNRIYSASPGSERMSYPFATPRSGDIPGHQHWMPPPPAPRHVAFLPRSNA